MKQARSYTDTEMIAGCLFVWLMGIVAAALVAAFV